MRVSDRMEKSLKMILMVMIMHYGHCRNQNCMSTTIFFLIWKGRISHVFLFLMSINCGGRSRILRNRPHGLFRYHNRVVIPCSAKTLKKVLILEYHDNVGHPNYRRLMAPLLERNWWDKMAFDCKSYCQHCVVCKRAKLDRKGGAALQPLGFLNYP